MVFNGSVNRFTEPFFFAFLQPVPLQASTVR